MSFAFTGFSCRPFIERGHNLGLMRCNQTFCYLSFRNLDFKEIVCLSCFAFKYFFSDRLQCFILYVLVNSCHGIFYQQRDFWCLNSILWPVHTSRNTFLHSNDFTLAKGWQILECYDEILQSSRQESRLRSSSFWVHLQAVYQRQGLNLSACFLIKRMEIIMYIGY